MKTTAYTGGLRANLALRNLASQFAAMQGSISVTASHAVSPEPAVSLSTVSVSGSVVATGDSAPEVPAAPTRAHTPPPPSAVPRGTTSGWVNANTTPHTGAAEDEDGLEVQYLD
eukprot:TRINITY_DN576_c0_g1_i1.p1 TRINITY_DN576_c0_g1~~TRINITY_DN576_c0_g1_i1.p1  ORF type:complete len:114 (-),score=10.05 TRINITY_DN576_c0_g1_i1:120-461(-)